MEQRNLFYLSPKTVSENAGWFGRGSWLNFNLLLVAVVLLLSPPVKAAGHWGANYFPDYQLIDHHGEPKRFFSDLLKDKIVVINFIYTSCPDTCPLETGKLREVYALLHERMGKDIFFCSITIDPEVDTVEVLNDYAEKWDIGPGWSFLRGNIEEVNHLRKKLGLDSDDDSQELEDHKINMIMGNQRTGRWVKRTPFDAPTLLARHLGTWLDNYRSAPDSSWTGYENAGEMRHISSGEYLFRTRCSSCHTVGGAAYGGKMLNIGPDLLAVDERHHQDWLVRWIMEPDKMIEEEDPKAMQLVAAYGGRVMPNLRLTEQDVSRVLEFIQTETSRYRKQLEGGSKPEPASIELLPESKAACPNCTAKKEVEKISRRNTNSRTESTPVKPAVWIPRRPQTTN